MVGGGAAERKSERRLKKGLCLGIVMSIILLGKKWSPRKLEDVDSFGLENWKGSLITVSTY